MPILINEVVIRANVVEPTNEPQPTPDKKPKMAEIIDRDQIISEAVSQVLRILRLKKER
jgi:Family of unknown function (DUF5908)